MKIKSENDCVVEVRSNVVIEFTSRGQALKAKHGVQALVIFSAGHCEVFPSLHSSRPLDLKLPHTFSGWKFWGY